MRLVEFTTTALRLAESWKGSAAGNVIAHDLENGRYYFVIADGAGAGTMVAMPEIYGYVPLHLHLMKEVTSGGAVGNAAAIGGLLASDTTPVLGATANESPIITWAASNNDIVGCGVDLPDDLDDTRDAYVELLTASGGTTNAASFTVETGWDNGALVSDNAVGAAATAVGNAIATVAAADIPASPRRLAVLLTPTAHTTDTKILHGARLKYFRK